MHALLARLTDCPELAMDEADAKTLFLAAQNVLRHYSLKSTQKTIDWITFTSVASFMYVPRVMLISQRRSQAAQRVKEVQPQATVFQFHPPSNGAAQEPEPVH